MKTYNSMKLQKDLKQKFVLDKLIEAGVMVGKSGKPVQNMDYEELKYELTLLAFREINISSDSNRWW